MRSEHKNTKHCYEKDGTWPVIYILAFFQVVASGQISPHFGCKGMKNVEYIKYI